MSLTQNTDYVGEGTALLLYQFDSLTSRSDKLIEFISIFLRQLQELEDAAFQVLAKLDITTAVGLQLDGIGQIIDLDREGRSDDDYRVLLAAQVKILQSSGTINELIEIISLILPAAGGAANSIKLYETFFTAQEIEDDAAGPGFYININFVPYTSLPFIARILRQARAAGIAGLVNAALTANPFTFAASTSFESSTLTGFGDDPSTIDGPGGEFSWITEI